MRGHRSLGHAQTNGDLTSREPFGGHYQHFAFAFRELDLDVPPALQTLRDMTHLHSRWGSQHHLVVRSLAQRLQEFDGVDVLVNESVGTDEECAADRGGVGVGAHTQHGVRGESLS